jgi:hypothetical protein
MKENPRIIQLLEDFELANPELAKIVRSLRKIVLEVAPKSEEKIMYGGIVFISDRMFCGIFLRKKYVTIEFDRGNEMNNPNKHLEGSGKYRRHLKMYNKEDIEKKMAKRYILESFKLKHL